MSQGGEGHGNFSGSDWMARDGTTVGTRPRVFTPIGLTQLEALVRFSIRARGVRFAVRRDIRAAACLPCRTLMRGEPRGVPTVPP